MPTRDSKIPNRSLTGSELKEVVIKHSGELVGQAEENLMFALRKKMDSDQLFGKQYAHPRVKIRMRCDFIWTNINLPKTGFTSEAEADSVFLDSAEIELEIDNPNLTRADAGLPFEQTVIDRPGPGQNFGGIRKEEIPVDTENLPKPTPPVETDKTDDLAGELKVPAEKLITGRRGRRGNRESH